jgi:hypothetical protein
MIPRDSFCIALMALTIVGSGTGWTADPPEFPKPASEHAFLKHFVGEWTNVTECKIDPSQPPIECAGKMKGRMLGEFWVVNESKASMMGTTMTAIQTIGYDQNKKKYVGTWVDSMTDHMWKYEGSVEGKTLTLEADGPNWMKPGTMAKFRDIYEVKSPDEIAIRSDMQMEDGSWNTFMTGTAKRIK